MLGIGYPRELELYGLPSFTEDKPKQQTGKGSESSVGVPNKEHLAVSGRPKKGQKQEPDRSPDIADSYATIAKTATHFTALASSRRSLGPEADASPEQIADQAILAKELKKCFDTEKTYWANKYASADKDDKFKKNIDLYQIGKRRLDMAVEDGSLTIEEILEELKKLATHLAETFGYLKRGEENYEWSKEHSKAADDSGESYVEPSTKSNLGQQFPNIVRSSLKLGNAAEKVRLGDDWDQRGRLFSSIVSGTMSAVQLPVTIAATVWNAKGQSGAVARQGADFMVPDVNSTKYKDVDGEQHSVYSSEHHKDLTRAIKKQLNSLTGDSNLEFESNKQRKRVDYLNKKMGHDIIPAELIDENKKKPAKLTDKDRESLIKDVKDAKSVDELHQAFDKLGLGIGTRAKWSAGLRKAYIVKRLYCEMLTTPAQSGNRQRRAAMNLAGALAAGVGASATAIAAVSSLTGDNIPLTTLVGGVGSLVFAGLQPSLYSWYHAGCAASDNKDKAITQFRIAVLGGVGDFDNEHGKPEISPAKLDKLLKAPFTTRMTYIKEVLTADRDLTECTVLQKFVKERSKKEEEPEKYDADTEDVEKMTNAQKAFKELKPEEQFEKLANNIELKRDFETLSANFRAMQKRIRAEKDNVRQNKMILRCSEWLANLEGVEEDSHVVNIDLGGDGKSQPCLAYEYYVKLDQMLKMASDGDIEGLLKMDDKWSPQSTKEAFVGALTNAAKQSNTLFYPDVDCQFTQKAEEFAKDEDAQLSDWKGNCESESNLGFVNQLGQKGAQSIANIGMGNVTPLIIKAATGFASMGMKAAQYVQQSKADHAAVNQTANASGVSQDDPLETGNAWMDMMATCLVVVGCMFAYKAMAPSYPAFTATKARHRARDEEQGRLKMPMRGLLDYVRGVVSNFQPMTVKLPEEALPKGNLIYRQSATLSSDMWEQIWAAKPTQWREILGLKSGKAASVKEVEELLKELRVIADEIIAGKEVTGEGEKKMERVVTRLAEAIDPPGFESDALNEFWGACRMATSYERDNEGIVEWINQVTEDSDNDERWTLLIDNRGPFAKFTNKSLSDLFYLDDGEGESVRVAKYKEAVNGLISTILSERDKLEQFESLESTESTNSSSDEESQQKITNKPRKGKKDETVIDVQNVLSSSEVPADEGGESSDSGEVELVRVKRAPNTDSKLDSTGMQSPFQSGGTRQFWNACKDFVIQNDVFLNEDNWNDSELVNWVRKMKADTKRDKRLVLLEEPFSDFDNGQLRGLLPQLSGDGTITVNKAVKDLILLILEMRS